MSKRSIKVQRENGTGFFNYQKQLENLKKSHETQRKNHIGIFDPEVHKKNNKIRIQSYIDNIKKMNLNIDLQAQDQFYSDVSYDFFQKYDKVPGVWSKELKDGTVLDVG
jgi:hypothetical protein